MPQPTARQPPHALEHVWLMHRVRVTTMLGSRVQVEAAVVFRALAAILGLRGRLWYVLCTCYAREALWKRQRGLHRRVVYGSIAALTSVRRYVDLGVLGELVCVVVGAVSVPGGHGGRICRCYDGCGSVGTILRPL